jgi:hypothetical protein
MSSRRALTCLLLAAFLNSCLRVSNAADWPLSGYAPCAVSTNRTLLKPWDTSLQTKTADIAFSDDDDILWMTLEGSIHNFRYSDGAFLSTLDLKATGRLL